MPHNNKQTTKIMRHIRTFTIATLLSIMMMPELLYGHNRVRGWVLINKGGSSIDSIVTCNANGICIEREIYQYKEDGSLSKSFIEMDENGEPYTKKISIYDAKYNLLSEITRWEDEEGVDEDKSEYTYDENGNQLSEINFSWEDGECVYAHKLEYTYDNNGKKLSEIDVNWEDGKWVYNTKSEYTYNTNSKELSHIKSVCKDGEWVCEYKEECTYGIDGNLQSNITAHYYEGEERHSKTEYCYNEKGLETSSIISFKSRIGNQWNLSNKTEYDYDKLGKIVGSMHYKYLDNQWVAYLSRRQETDTILTAQGRQIIHKERHWKREETSYDFTSRDVLTYIVSPLNPDSLMCVQEEHFYDDKRTEVYMREFDDQGSLIGAKEIKWDENNQSHPKSILYLSFHDSVLQPDRYEEYRFEDEKPVLESTKRYYYSNILGKE